MDDCDEKMRQLQLEQWKKDSETIQKTLRQAAQTAVELRLIKELHADKYFISGQQHTHVCHCYCVNKHDHIYSHPKHVVFGMDQAAHARQALNLSTTWRRGAVGRVSDLRSRGRWFESRPGMQCRNPGQVSHTYVPLFTKQYKLVPA